MSIDQISNGEPGNSVRNKLNQLISAAYRPSNILGPVSQSGGDPTGAVIERDSNDDGEYVRFADGTQICTHRMAGSSSESETWTYPAVFASEPRVVGTPRVTSLPRMVGIVSSAGSASFRVFTEAGAGSVVDVNLTAIGRWF